MDYQYIGKSFPASDAAAKASGELTFTEDMVLPCMAYMKLVLSPAAHGIVRSLDVSVAEAVPGVLAVLTPDNTPQTYYTAAACARTRKSPTRNSCLPVMSALSATALPRSLPKHRRSRTAPPRSSGWRSILFLRSSRRQKR